MDNKLDWLQPCRYWVRWITPTECKEFGGSVDFLQNYIRKYYPFEEMLVMYVHQEFSESLVELVHPRGLQILRSPWLGIESEPSGYLGRISLFNYKWIRPTRPTA